MHDDADVRPPAPEMLLTDARIAPVAVAFDKVKLFSPNMVAEVRYRVQSVVIVGACVLVGLSFDPSFGHCQPSRASDKTRRALDGWSVNAEDEVWIWKVRR